MNSASLRGCFAVVIAFGIATGAGAQEDESDRPSWRSAEDTPALPELPPDVERPEMEFEVGRTEFERPTFDTSSMTDLGSQETVAPELGRVATWRERRAAEAEAARQEAVAAEAEAAVAEASAVDPVDEASAVDTDTTVAALGPAPEPVLDLDTEDLASTAAPAVTAERLRPVETVSPDYPRQAYLDREEGWVDVEFSVNADGSVESVRAVDAEPRRTFEKSALRAASGWRFAPTGVDGQTGVFRFEFNMDG